MSEGSIPSLHTQLRKGLVVLDSEFDAIYPVDVRIVSSCFWTPVSVARRAAELLVRKQNDRVLDVGSGVGKFCIVGAAATGATFVGIEQRLRLVGVAEAARQQIGAQSAHFIQGSFDSVDVTSFDAIYFFNPFEENLFEPDLQLDHDVHLCEERFSADVERAESLLRRARTGTRVVTYHGFGGEMPAGYDLIHRERHHADKLELWRKSAHET